MCLIGWPELIEVLMGWDVQGSSLLSVWFILVTITLEKSDKRIILLEIRNLQNMLSWEGQGEFFGF